MGTSNQITENKSILHDLSSFLSFTTVTLTNDSSLAESVATLKITTFFLLIFVFYISKFSFNL